MDKYAASTFISHICIPFNYSGLLGLQDKLNDWLDNSFNVLKQWNFKLSNYDLRTLNSTFQLYKGNKNETFKLSNYLLVNLPHVLAR